MLWLAGLLQVFPCNTPTTYSNILLPKYFHAIHLQHGNTWIKLCTPTYAIQQHTPTTYSNNTLQLNALARRSPPSILLKYSSKYFNEINLQVLRSNNTPHPSILLQYSTVQLSPHLLQHLYLFHLFQHPYHKKIFAVSLSQENCIQPPTRM